MPINPHPGITGLSWQAERPEAPDSGVLARTFDWNGREQAADLVLKSSEDVPLAVPPGALQARMKVFEHQVPLMGATVVHSTQDQTVRIDTNHPTSAAVASALHFAEQIGRTFPNVTYVVGAVGSNGLVEAAKGEDLSDLARQMRTMPEFRQAVKPGPVSPAAWEVWLGPTQD